MRDRLAAGDPAPLTWPFAPVLLALAAAWLVLGWPWLSGRVTIPWDAKAHFQPQIQFLAASLARGEWPFWAPYVFSGHPQVADPQSLIFSPPFLLLAAVDGSPSLWAADTTVLATVLAGAAALMLWFRDQRWHWAGALVAGICFAFGASMAWRIQHTGQVLSLAYLPMVLVLLSRALDRRSWLHGLGAGIVAGFMVLGRDQVALLSVYLLIGFVAWRLASGQGLAAEARAAAPSLAAGALGGLAVIALPILLTVLVAGESNRPAIDLEGAGRGSLHPALFVTLFAPDLFGSSSTMEEYWGPPSFAWNTTGLYIAQNMGQLYFGALPLLLLLLGVARGWMWSREVRFFAVALSLVSLYALGWYTPFFALAHKLLPGVDYFRRPADATFVMGFLMAVLAGYATHRLWSEPYRGFERWQVAVVALVVTAAFASAAGMAVGLDRVARALKPGGIALAIFASAALVLVWAMWLLPIRPVAAAGLAVAFTVADLAYSNGPGSATALPTAHYEVLEPASRNETIAALKRLTSAGASETRRDRIELLGFGFHWPNASLTHGLENTLGYNPVRLGGYSRAAGAEDHIVSPGDRKFTALFPSYKSPLADLLGLRYVASPVPLETVDKRLAPGDLAIVARAAEGFVYENPRALPRAMFVTASRPVDFAALMTSGWPEGFEPARTVLLDAASPPKSFGGAGRVRIAGYRNTEIVVEADSSQGGFVILNDIWHPWWFAEIDGKDAPLLQANVLFRAVEVPPGSHRVRFLFRPVAGALAQLRRKRL